MNFECFECGRTADLELGLARDSGWYAARDRTGEREHNEICPECTVEHGYRSQAQYEAVRAWYQRRRELGATILEHVCDECGAKLSATREEARTLGWRKAWRRRKAQGLRYEHVRCVICYSRTSPGRMKRG